MTVVNYSRQTSNRSALLTNLTPNHLYSVQVRAATSAGYGPSSEIILKTTQQKGAKNIPVASFSAADFNSLLALVFLTFSARKGDILPSSIIEITVGVITGVSAILLLLSLLYLRSRSVKGVIKCN